jgi:hypothetical protein
MPSSAEQAQLERWVATWREAGPALEAQQRAELARLDTPAAMAQLAAAFARALAESPQRDTSGLVEQQRYFQQLSP